MYPSESEILQAKNYLRNISSKISFKEGFSCYKKYREWRKSLSSTIDYSYGVTKIVFLDALENWVIKLDIPEDDPQDTKFYCKIEAENYQKACKNHLEWYFAETYYIGMVDEINVYLQRRADCKKAEYDVDDIFYKSASEVYTPWNTNESEDDRTNNINCCVQDFDIEQSLLAIYSNEKDCEDLINFAYENCINDLHNQNFGYINGHLVIVDFSGY